MSDGGWAKRRQDFTDLEHRAEELYQFAWEGAQTADTAGAAAKFLAEANKAVRLHAELREKTLRPAQLASLQEQIDRVEQKLSAHYAGGNNRARETPGREGEPPPWRQ